MSKNILLLIFIGVICPMFSSKAANPNSHSSNNIRLYFPAEKGVERVVLERQRIGARLPTRTDIENFNSGYYDVTLDKATTFSAIAFDADKHSRIIPISMDEQVTSYAGSGKRDKANYLSMRCDNIGSDGIGSAYIPHSFSVENEGEVSSYLWHFYLKNQQGKYVEVSGGDTTSTFEIAEITEPEKYAVTDGCLDGIVECLYTVSDNQYYTILFPLSLTLDDVGLDDITARDTEIFIEMFTLQGVSVFKGTAAAYDETVLPSGIYIRRETDRTFGITKTSKIII